MKHILSPVSIRKWSCTNQHGWTKLAEPQQAMKVQIAAHYFIELNKHFHIHIFRLLYTETQGHRATCKGAVFSLFFDRESLPEFQ